MLYKKIALCIALVFVVACQSNKPLKTVDYVDIQRFMGDWYVIANIPTFLEKDAYNPIESYRLDEDGSIVTTFSFNAGAMDGEKKVYNPRGFIINNETNAEWGMQFIWPIKAQYIIAYIDEGYENTIVARDKRDYLWFMSRTTDLPTEKKQWIYKKTSELGYDKDMLRFVPHN